MTVLGMLSMLAMAPLPAQTRPASKIEAALLSKLFMGDTADLIVVFSEQADLSAAYGMGWDERGEYVYGTLKAVAERSQDAHHQVQAADVVGQRPAATHRGPVFEAGHGQEAADRRSL